jgi:hypothetical protein
MARYLRANTATIVTVGPFYDKTDGVTIENSLTITNEKITMVVDNNDGSAPTIVLDNVTGATSGTDNDLNYISGCDAGLMQLELSAANTNYAGKRVMLTITDAANHVPVFHEFTILPANVYDSLCLGTEKLKTDIDTIKTQAITCAAGVTVLASVGTASASTAQSGDAYARLGAPAGASVSADVAAVKVDTAAVLSDTGTDGVVVAAASKTGYALSSAGIDAVFDQASSVTLTFEQLIVRLYQMISNKMTVNETNGNVALRNIGDTGDIATGKVASAAGTTTRSELTWS